MEEVSIHGKLQSLVESEVPPKKKKDALLESEAATKPHFRRVVVRSQPPSSNVYGGGNINDGRGISTHDEEKEIVEKTFGKHRAAGRRGRGSSLINICLKRHC